MKFLSVQIIIRTQACQDYCLPLPIFKNAAFDLQVVQQIATSLQYFGGHQTISYCFIHRVIILHTSLTSGHWVSQRREGIKPPKSLSQSFVTLKFLASLSHQWSSNTYKNWFLHKQFRNSSS